MHSYLCKQNICKLITFIILLLSSYGIKNKRKNKYRMKIFQKAFITAEKESFQAQFLPKLQFANSHFKKKYLKFKR